jgi:hypothetical protein
MSDKTQSIKDEINAEVNTNEEETIDVNDTIDTIDNSSWQTALSINLQMFLYYLSPKEELKISLQKSTKKTSIIAGIFMLLSLDLITLVLFGMIDGMNAEHEILQGNIKIYSQLFATWGIFTFLLLYLFIFIGAFLVPFLMSVMINKNRAEDLRKSRRQIFIGSCYGMIAILFYIQIIHMIALWSGWSNPQEYQLLGYEWENAWEYFPSGLLMIISLFGLYHEQRKIFDFSRGQSLITPGFIFIVLLAIILIFLVNWG